MTLAESAWMAASLALPGLAFIIGMTFGRGSLPAGTVGSSLAGAAIGAYVGSLAAERLPDLDASVTVLRGGLLGLGAGLAVGIVLAAALFAWRASRSEAAKEDDDGEGGLFAARD